MQTGPEAALLHPDGPGRTGIDLAKLGGAAIGPDYPQVLRTRRRAAIAGAVAGTKHLLAQTVRTPAFLRELGEEDPVHGAGGCIDEMQFRLAAATGRCLGGGPGSRHLGAGGEAEGEGDGDQGSSRHAGNPLRKPRG